MGNASTVSCKPEDEAPARSSKDRHKSSSENTTTSKSSISGVGPLMTERAKRVVGDLQASLHNSVKKLEENDHPAAQLLDQVCGGMTSSYFEEGHHHTRSSSFYSEEGSDDETSSRRTISEEEDETLIDDDTKNMAPAITSSSRRTGKKDAETASYLESEVESERPRSSSNNNTSGKRDIKKLDSQSMESESSNNQGTTMTADVMPSTLVSPGTSTVKAPPLASSFAKRCYFTKAGIGKTTQHYEGLTLTGNVVLMLAAAMKLKGCPTICDEDLRRVEQTYPNQFSRLPDELLLSSGWRRISKYCHFSNKPIPDGVPFFHSKQRLHPGGGYYFLLAAAVGMVRPIDVEPLTRDTLVLLETDYPTQCDAAPPELIQDPSQWTLVDKFCFFSGGPINTEEDVYYQADFDGNPIYMLAFLSPSLTPEELYKLNEASTSYGLKSLAAVEEVESVYDLTERDFDDLKLYHLGPCRALPQYLLQPHAWTKVLPPRFLAARQKALIRAQEYESRFGGPMHGPMEQRQLAPSAQPQIMQHPGSYGPAGTPHSNAYYGPEWGQPSPHQPPHHMPQQPQGISPAYMSQPPSMHSHPDGASLGSGRQHESADPYYHNHPQPQGIRGAGPHQSHFNYAAATPSPYAGASQAQYDPYGFEGSTGYTPSHAYYNQTDEPGADLSQGAYYEGRYPHPDDQHYQQQEQQSMSQHSQSHRGPQYPDSSFQREIEEEGAFVDVAAPMDEAIATRAHKLSPARYSNQEDIKEDITDVPDDYDDEDQEDEQDEDDNEPPSLSRQKWVASNHRQGDNGYHAATPKSIPDPLSAYYAEEEEADDLAGPQKNSNGRQGRSYETGEQPESRNGEFYDDSEYVLPAKHNNGRNGTSYHNESPTIHLDQTESKRSESAPASKTAKSSYHASNDYQYGGPEDEMMPNEYGDEDEAYDPREAEEEEDRSGGEYYRTVPNLVNELGYVSQKRLQDNYASPNGQSGRSVDQLQREREKNLVFIRGSAPAAKQEQRVRPETTDSRHEQHHGLGTGSGSPTSEYTHSSAMRGAQELLKKNRQKRQQMAQRHDHVNSQEHRAEEELDPARSPHTRTDEESGGTWESGSEVTTSVISGSSVWTDSSNAADRSSRRALILQMAKARMKSNKERGSSATVHSEDQTHIPIREESVEYSREEIMRDTKSEVNTDIDFTGDLD